jgi:hypothetical protein
MLGSKDPIRRSEMKLGPKPMFILAAIVGMLALGCGTAEREPDASDTDTAPPAAEGRDLSSLDVCALVPGEEVAALFEGTLAREPESTIYPGASTECDYVIEAGGRTQVALVFLYPPSYYELFGDEEGERQEIAGLGDGAYATTSSGIAEVHVLVDGDVTVDARAGTVEEARRLAELTLSKL